MDWNTICTVITTVGFPIAACVAMGLYVKYITDENRKQIDAMNSQHKSEMDQLSNALNNNTIAIQKLTDYIERMDKHE